MLHTHEQVKWILTMEDDWTKTRTYVMGSRLLLGVLRTLEKYEVEETDQSYTLRINEKERAPSATVKTRYRMAEDLNKQYPSIVRALFKLRDLGLITGYNIEKGDHEIAVYAWTYKAVILLPETAPLEPLSGTYTKLFGDWEDWARHICDLIKCEVDEAKAIMTFLCWMSRDFLRWIRDEIVLPANYHKEKLPELESHEYWRRLAIKYVIKEYVLYMSEDSEKYFGEAFKNLSGQDLKITNSLSDGLKKVLRFAGTMFSGEEFQHLRYIG